MKNIIKRTLATSTALVAAVGLVGAPVSANHMYQTNLTELNGSGTSGTAMVEKLDENRVKVTLSTTGTSADLPHAQHLHIGGNNVCPDMSADINNDDIIDGAEGVPSYGDVKVSLTTEGDTSAESALAVDRFPVADEGGTVEYTRTFDLPSGVSMEDLDNAVVVQHGISDLFNNPDKYDGDKKSSLDESLPLEATVPTACGALTSAAVGGVSTGTGETVGLENSVYAIAGAMALVTSAVILSKRFSSSKQ